jgi:hypothetical protein
MRTKIAALLLAASTFALAPALMAQTGGAGGSGGGGTGAGGASGGASAGGAGAGASGAGAAGTSGGATGGTGAASAGAGTGTGAGATGASSGTGTEASGGKEQRWPLNSNSWTNERGRVQQQWSRLTDQDLATAPTREQLVTAIQSRYGVPRAEAERQVDTWAMQAQQSGR